MIVNVDLRSASPTVSVEDAADLKSLKLVAYADQREPARLGTVLASIDSGTDGDDALLDIDALKRLSGAAADDPRWRAAFDQMVTYAASKGWVGPGATLRAHCEWRR